jgi:hypothetical protein
MDAASAPVIVDGMHRGPRRMVNRANGCGLKGFWMSVHRDNGLTRVRRGVRGSGAVAGLLAMGIVAIASACSSGNPAAGGGGCPPLTLNVVAAPQIAPAIETIAASFNATHPKPGGNCVKVAVQQAEPAAVANSLSGQGVITTPAKPDAWIPDSTLWIDQARATTAGAAKVSAMGESVAISPIVLALPATVAAALAKAGKPASWKMLIPNALPTNTASGSTGTVAAPAAAAPLQLKVLDPVTNAAGLAGLLAIRTVVGHGQAGLVRFVTVARVTQFVTEPDDAALFGAMFSSAQPTAGVTAEQAVLVHNKTDPKHPAAAVYPSEGSPVLDFPYVATTQDPAKRLAIAAFARALHNPAGEQAVLALGLRAPDGTAAPGVGPAVGVSTQAPAPIPLPSASVVNSVRTMWASILVGARMLIVLDESPSMGRLVPGTNITRLQAIQELSVEGISLFNKNDVIGLWTFDTGLADPFNYRVVLPMRPLNQPVPLAAGGGTATQRQLLLGALAVQRPQVDTVTALYQTIRSAYREVSRGYIPDRFNGVIVDTDGTDFDPRPNPLKLNQLLATLRSEYNPQKPVNVIILGYGHSVDFPAMTKIAAVTGGEAYQANSPAGVETFYLQMLTQLVCNNRCPAP